MGGLGEGRRGDGDFDINPFVAWVLEVSRGGFGGPGETTTSMSRCEWGCPREPASVKERVCVWEDTCQSSWQGVCVSARGPVVPVAREWGGGVGVA